MDKIFLMITFIIHGEMMYDDSLFLLLQITERYNAIYDLIK